MRWNKIQNKKYPVDLLVTTNSTSNILVEIIAKTTNNNITVKSINTLNENTRYKLTLLVENKQTLDKYISELKSIENILDIERLIQ